MTILDWLGEDVRLVTECPDWPVSARITVPTEKLRGLTGREARRARGTTLRVEMRWESTLTQQQVASLRSALQTDSADEDMRFLVPFWPAYVPVAEAASAPLGSEGLWVGWSSDFQTWTLAPNTGSLSGVDYAAPGLVGRLEVEAEASDAEVLRVRFTFLEDAPSAAGYALAPAAVTWEQGPELPDASRPKVFRWAADWRQDPATGTAESEAVRRKMGAARGMAAAYFPQIAERLVQAQVSLVNPTEAAEFLRWWQDVRGDVEAHYASTLLTDARLAVPALAGATTITLHWASALGANRLLVLDDTSGRREWVRIQSISGDVCTLVAPLAYAWTPGTTQLSLAMLARHAQADVEVEWANPDYATATLAWREVPAELQPAAGETRGTTLGAEATLAWLYELTVQRVGGASEVTRLTSYERDLTASGQTWTTWPVDHAEIRRSLRMDRDETSLRLRYREPLSVFLPGRHDAVLRVAIRRCSVSGSTGSSVEQLFGGEVTRYEADGPFVTLSCAGINRVFSRPVPRYLMQKGCNYALFDVACGLSRSGWSLTASVVSVSGASVTLGSFTPGGSVPGDWGGAHWFAAGYLERSGGRRLLILDSTAKSGGQVTLTLVAAAVPSLAVSDAVTVVPGCDGDFSTCLGKFTNSARFGGFPYLPDRSPQLAPLPKTPTKTGKK